MLLHRLGLINMKQSFIFISINTKNINLDQLIKWIGLSETGGQARMLIDNGAVMVNDIIIKQRRKKINPGDYLTIVGQKYMIVTEEININAC